MSLIETYNLSGLIIGILTFLVIGLFHPLVIKAEYYLGTGCWWIFVLAGAAGIAGALCFQNIIISAASGVFAFSSLWSVRELFEQKKRVEKGWFPRNPGNRQGKTTSGASSSVRLMGRRKNER